MQKQQQQSNTFDYGPNKPNQSSQAMNQAQTNKSGVQDGKQANQQQNFQINIQQYFISQQNPQHSNQFDQRTPQYQQQQNAAQVLNLEDSPNAAAGAGGPDHASAGNQARIKNQDKDGFQYYSNQQNTRKTHKQSSSQQKIITQQNEIKTLKRTGQELSKMKKTDEKLQFDNLAKAQAQAQQSRCQSQEPRQINKVAIASSLNADSSDAESSQSADMPLYKDRQYAAHNEPVSIYHQVSGEDLRKIIFFQQHDGKERFREFKQLMVLYQNEIKKRWEERAQIKNTYKFPRVKSQKKSKSPAKQAAKQETKMEENPQKLKNHYSPNPVKKPILFSNRTLGNNSQYSSQGSQQDSSRNQSANHFLMVHRKIAQQNPQVNPNTNHSKMLKSNEIPSVQADESLQKKPNQSVQPKSKQKSAPRVQSSKHDSQRVADQQKETTNRSKAAIQHSRANTQMTINVPNKFENNLPIMKPGGLTRDEQQSISAENIMKSNISANLTSQQAFHSRNVSFIQIEQKGQNLSMPANGKTMQSQMTHQTEHSQKILPASATGQNPSTGKNKPKQSPIEEKKLQQHFKSMQNFMPAESQPSLAEQKPGTLSNDENYHFHKQMPSIQVDGPNQFASLGQNHPPQNDLGNNASEADKRQNLDYVKQRLQEMVHERQSKADSKFKKVKYKGRVQQYNNKMPKVTQNAISQPKIMGSQNHVQNQEGASSRFQQNNVSNNKASISQQQIFYHQPQNAPNFANQTNIANSNNDVLFGLPEAASQKASHRSNHNRAIKSDQIPHMINQIKYSSKNSVNQGAGRNQTGGMQPNPVSLNMQRNLEGFQEKQERVRQASEQQRQSAEQSSQPSNFPSSPEKLSVKMDKKSIVQTQKLQKNKASVIGAGNGKPGQGKLVRQDASFSYSQAQFQTPEQVGLLPDHKLLDSRAHNKNLQNSIANQNNHQMSHQLLQNNYKNNINGLGLNKFNNNSTLSAETLNQINQYNTSSGQTLLPQQVRPVPRGMNISGVTQPRDVQRSVNMQSGGQQDNKVKSGDLSMSKSLTFNQANVITQNKQQTAGMSDAMLRKMQYKQQAQLNQSNMEQQRVLIDKLKKIQTNSKKSQKRIKGGSPVKMQSKHPKSSQEIDIQIQNESQDNGNNFKIQNYDDRYNDISMIPEAWKESTELDDQTFFMHLNQSNQSNKNSQQQFNTVGQQKRGGQQSVDSASLAGNSLQNQPHQGIIPSFNHDQYFPSVRNQQQAQNYNIQAYNSSQDQREQHPPQPQQQQIKSLVPPYAGSHNMIVVPAPPNVRTNSSNLSVHSGTASKKVTFSYYNDESASGGISTSNVTSTTSAQFLNAQNQMIRNNQDGRQDFKSEQKGLKDHAKAGPKATMPQEVKTIKQSAIVSAHNHAKSMHQLEKLFGHNNNNQEGMRQFGESLAQLQQQNSELMLQQQNQFNNAMNNQNDQPNNNATAGTGTLNYNPNQFKAQHMQRLSSNTNLSNSATALRNQAQQQPFANQNGNNMKPQPRKMKNSQGPPSIQVSLPQSNQAKSNPFQAQSNIVMTQKQSTKAQKQMKKSVELYKPNNMVLQQSNAFKATQMVQDSSTQNIVTLHMNRGGAQMQQKSKDQTQEQNPNMRIKRPTSSGKHSSNGGRRKRTTSNNSYSYNQQQNQNNQMKIQTYGFGEPEYLSASEQQMLDQQYRGGSQMNNPGMVGGPTNIVNMATKMAQSSSNKSVKKSQGMVLGHQYSNSYSSNGANINQSISAKQNSSNQQITTINNLQALSFGSLAKQGKRLKN